MKESGRERERNHGPESALQQKGIPGEKAMCDSQCRDSLTRAGILSKQKRNTANSLFLIPAQTFLRV